MTWDWTAVEWPAAVLALGLMLAGWVLLGSREANGWHRLTAAGLLLAGFAVLGKQLLDQVFRPELPDMAQCQMLLAAQPGDEPETPVDIAPPNTMGFVSGATWGVYWRLGEDLASLTRGLKVPLTNLRSRGSVDNAARMQGSANAGLGMLQGDLPWTKDESADGAINLGKISAVGEAHLEHVQVLSRMDVLRGPNGGSLADLKGQRVMVAADSQGAFLTARKLLKWANTDGVMVYKAKAEVALCEVVTGRAAAMVVVAGKPTPLLIRLSRLSLAWPRALQRLRFVPVQQRMDNPSGPLPDVYESSELGRKHYPWLNTDVPVRTVSVRAMLVSYDFDGLPGGASHPKCVQITQLVCMLRSQRLRLRQPPYDPAWREVGPFLPASASGTWPINRCVPAANVC